MFNSSNHPVRTKRVCGCTCLDYEVISEFGVSNTSIYEGAEVDVFSLENRIKTNSIGDGVKPSFRSSRLAMTDEINSQITNLKK